MTSKSMTRDTRSTRPYRVNTVAVKKLCNSFVRTDLVTGSRFPPSVFDEILRLCALDRSTITFVCDHLTTSDYPSLDTVHRQLAQLDLHTVVDTINTRLSEIAAHAKRLRLLPKKKQVDLAIDCTDLPYYGDPNEQGVVGGKPKKSTKWFFRFATICIVEDEYRFPLGVLPVDQLRNSDLTGVVTELLEMASRHVSVNVLLLDRGFHSVKLFKKLKILGVSWLMPAKNTKRVKEGMEELKETARRGGSRSKRIVLSGQGGEVCVALMVKWSKKKQKWLGYLSDRRRKVKRYGKRWGIETQYRVVNKSRGWTTSKSWVVRVVLYGFGMLVNGVWELYRRLLRRGSRDVVQGRRGRRIDRVFKVWAEKMGQLKVFIVILLEILPLGGEIM